MKTEKEFLEGIYRKAQERQETAEESVAGRKMPIYQRAGIAAAAAAAVVVLALPLGAFGLWNNKTPEKQQKAMPNHEADSASYRMYTPSTHIFEGTITKMEETENGIRITAVPVAKYRGEQLGEVILEAASQKEESSQALTVGEITLFYVIEENGGYRINDTENGICHYRYIEDGYRVYENQYGEKVNTKDLMEK